jgi:ketosteroid isomerase-like protein
MSRLIASLWGTVLAVGVSVAALAPVHAVNASAARDEAAIKALEARFADGFNAKDVDAIMDVYARGSGLFVFDVTPPRQHSGWADYKADWQDLFKAFPGAIHFSISDLSIAVVGPVAYGHSIQQVLFTQANGSKVDNVLRVTDVYRKIHGRWLIVQEHVSVPVDSHTGKADWLSKP